MSLSNTAVPKYYGEFRDAVSRGDVPVNREILMEMRRIDFLIDNQNYYYDSDAVEGYIKFCENELTLTDGSRFKMLPTFKLWAEEVYGWYYFVDRSVYVPNEDNHGGHYERKMIKKRLITKQFLIVGRGASKTMYDMSHHAYMVAVDKTTTHQIATAPTMRQAEETLAPLRTALTRTVGPLFKFLCMGSLQNTTGSRWNRVRLTSTKKGIQNFITESIVEVLPMTIDKLQGYRPRLSTVDEWLSGDIREDVIGALEQGASKLDDYLIIATSSEGTVRNGPGDTIKMELMSILRGEYFNPHVSIWWYKLDDIKEVGDPAMWVKAQPNIGKTVSYEAYQMDVERMESAPSTRNDILAKRFGIPTEGYTYYFTYEETLPTTKNKEFWGMQCSMGVDLSQGDDFCAFTFLFPIGNGTFGVKTRCYISYLTLTKLQPAAREKYEEFIKEGSLYVLDGNVLDMVQVYDDLEEYIDRMQYDVCCVGYDPYNAQYFIGRWISENGQFGVDKVIQGKKTESVPLGEIKNLAHEKSLIFDQSIITYTMGNCISLEDTNGNRMILKRRYDRKIDSVAALLDAWVSYKINKDNLFG